VAGHPLSSFHRMLNAAALTASISAVAAPAIADCPPGANLAGCLYQQNLNATGRSWNPPQSPTYVQPNGSGSYVVTSPGLPPSYNMPNGAGGYTVTAPGQPPTYGGWRPQ
jgi:hypothetical protein